MKNATTTKKAAETTKKTAKTAPTNAVKAKSGAAKTLRELFEDGLKDIYWAEKALTKAIPKMAKNATTKELADGLTSHLKETETQVTRLEKAFELIGKKAVAKKCDAMDGLIKEGESIMEETEVGAVRDAGIIAASQKIEHYEIATYGTLASWAQTLGEHEVAKLLGESLNEEKNADLTLSQVAYGDINIDAKTADKTAKK